MKISFAHISRRVPKGRKLPARFEALVRANLPDVDIEWDDLDSFSLKRSALKEAVPFLHLSDGGIVFLWYRTAEPAVVYFSSDGVRQVVAADFDNFLKGINARCSGVPDIDEDERPFSIPRVRGKPKRAGLASLQKELDKWFKQHTSLLEPHRSPEAELLRQRVYQIGKAMTRDGLSKVYTDLSSWWSWEYRIKRDGDDIAITYRDYGQWYPVPAKYELVKEVKTLLTLVKNKNRQEYALSINCKGGVSIDGDRELLLVGPKDEETPIVAEVTNVAVAEWSREGDKINSGGPGTVTFADGTSRDFKSIVGVMLPSEEDDWKVVKNGDLLLRPEDVSIAWERIKSLSITRGMQIYPTVEITTAEGKKETYSGDCGVVSCVEIEWGDSVARSRLTLQKLLGATINLRANRKKRSR